MPGRDRRYGAAVGGFFVSMGGVHLGIVVSDPETYRHFADGSMLGFVRAGWQDVFMAQPVLFGLLLAAAETTAGVLLLVGGRCARPGWTAVIVFHVLLMLFGPGIWLWCVPALAVLVTWARRDPAVTGGRARPAVASR